jgi:hypothetical protein
MAQLSGLSSWPTRLHPKLSKFRQFPAAFFAVSIISFESHSGLLFGVFRVIVFISNNARLSWVRATFIQDKPCRP